MLRYVSLLPVHTPAHTTFYSMNTGNHSPGVKQPRRETAHQPPSSVEV